MSTKSVPWFEPEITGREIYYLQDVLRRGYINDGPLTHEFEIKVADLCGVDHAIAVTSGTVAISLALMALGVTDGDEVIVPDLTFIATANAVRLAGATPVLVDIESLRFSIDCDKIESAMTPFTKAIVSVDVNGRGANYHFLENFCREKGLHLVCDSAEAFGSKYDGRPLGSFGDAAALSFSANKTVTTGQGGMVLTCNVALAERIRQLKDQGRLKRGTGGDDLHPTQGFNFKFTDLQAAVGLAQLEVLENRLEQANHRDYWYRKHLSGCEQIIMPPKVEGEICQWADALLTERDELKKQLDANGMGSRSFWHPLHRQVPYLERDEKFTNSITVSSRGLWLPSKFNLREDDVKMIAEKIKRIMG
jgi:perosamine synthetase